MNSQIRKLRSDAENAEADYKLSDNKETCQRWTMLAQQMVNVSPVCGLPPSAQYFVWSTSSPHSPPSPPSPPETSDPNYGVTSNKQSTFLYIENEK